LEQAESVQRPSSVVAAPQPRPTPVSYLAASQRGPIIGWFGHAMSTHIPVLSSRASQTTAQPESNRTKAQRSAIFYIL
jgi:hypothetical protein